MIVVSALGKKKGKESIILWNYNILLTQGFLTKPDLTNFDIAL
jgi:hypothetical protein